MGLVVVGDTFLWRFIFDLSLGQTTYIAVFMTQAQQIVAALPILPKELKQWVRGAFSTKARIAALSQPRRFYSYGEVMGGKPRYKQRG